MKILHWDEMFHPAFGYQINVLAKYQAMQNNEVVIYTAQHPEIHPTFRGLNKVDVEKLDKEYSKKYHVKIVRLPIYGVISGRVIYKEGFIKKIKEEAPDILMCHTNDTLSAIYIAKRYKYLNMPIVFDNHMLEMGSQNPFRKFFRMYFRYRVTPLIKKNRWKVIRTQDDTFVEREYGIPLEQAPFISFGSDINMFHPDMNVKKEFRKKYGIRLEDFVVVYTGKISEAKGGKLLALAFKEKFQASRNVVLVVVGTARSQYELEVEDIFKQSNTFSKVMHFFLFSAVHYHEFAASSISMPISGSILPIKFLK